MFAYPFRVENRPYVHAVVCDGAEGVDLEAVAAWHQHPLERVFDDGPTDPGLLALHLNRDGALQPTVVSLHQIGHVS